MSDLSGRDSTLNRSFEYLRQEIRQMDIYGPAMASITITNIATNISLPSVTLLTLPSNAEIVRAMAIFLFAELENTAGGVNSLSGDQYIQVQKEIGGSWMNCVTLKAGLFSLGSGATRGGGVIMGDIDCASEVDTPGVQYDMRIASALAVDASLIIKEVQTGLRVYYRLL